MKRNTISIRITLAALLTGAVLAFSGCSAKDAPDNYGGDDSKAQGGGRKDPNSFRYSNLYQKNQKTFILPDSTMCPEDKFEDFLPKSK